MDAAEAAGVDEVEEPQVRGHIERESMIAHPFADCDADRRDLRAADPHSGPPGRPLALDAPAGERLDQPFLDRTQEAVEVPAPAFQVAHQVTDQLPRPMPGDVSP